MNISKSIRKKSSFKDSAAKPLGKPTAGYKAFRLEPAILFYNVEDGDYTEKLEEAEILVVYQSSLAASKQNLVKRQLPYIGMFDHKVPVVSNAMRDFTVILFEHLEIISPKDVEKRLAYTHLILRGAALKKYREVL